MSKSTVMTLAERLHATWDEGASGGTGTMDAPQGHKWTATNTHGIAVDLRHDRASAWRDLLSDMRSGLFPCDEGSECEICHPDGAPHTVKPMTVYTDPRVTQVGGGGSHDWIHTTTLEDAEALIKEYGLNVKYLPIPDPQGYTFAIV